MNFLQDEEDEAILVANGNHYNGNQVNPFGSDKPAVFFRVTLLQLIYDFCFRFQFFLHFEAFCIETLVSSAKHKTKILIRDFKKKMVE